MAIDWKKIVGALVVILLVSGIVYIAYGQEVKIRVDYDKSTIYVFENSRWIVGGREYNALFDGTSKMNRRPSEITIETTIGDNNVTIKRTTPYIRGPVIVDTYYFEGDITEKELFPIYHTVEIYNGSGFFYRYEVRELFYDGETKKLNVTYMKFGKDISVEWNAGYRWAWVYKTGILKVQYDIPSNYEIYNVRLFDPPGPATSFISPTPANDTLASSIQINVSINESSLKKVIHNWDGTNVTIYDTTDLIFMLNLDNVSALGENDTYIVDLVMGNNGTSKWTTLMNMSGGKYMGGVELNKSVYFNFSDVDDLDMGTNNFTIELWVKGDNPSQYGSSLYPLVSKMANYPDSGYIIDVNKDYFYVRVREGGTGRNSYTAVAQFLDGNWHHVAAIYDRSDKIDIYLDGSEVSYNQQLSITGVGNLDTPFDFLLAASHNGTVGFNGSIDEVRIWNRSLTASEILQHYMTSLNQYDSGKWLLTTNQVKNSTDELDSGTYTYQAFAYDTSDNLNATEERTINIDTASPIVSLYNITGITDDDTPGIDFNFTDEELKAECYLLFNGTAYDKNASTDNATRTTMTANESMADDDYAVIVQCSDSLNIGNSSPIILTIDTTAPSNIGFLAPTPPNGTIVTQDNYLVNVSFVDANPDRCELELTNSSGTSNYTMTQGTNETEYYFNVAGQSDYSTHFYAYCNDTIGYLGMSVARHVEINTIPPTVAVENPENNSVTTYEWVWINMTTDGTSQWCGYSLDETGNITLSNDSATHYYANLTDLTRGTYNITFNCNDTGGNVNTSLMYFFGANLTPNISVSLITTPFELNLSTGSFSFNYTDNTVYWYNATPKGQDGNGTFNVTSDYPGYAADINVSLNESPTTCMTFYLSNSSSWFDKLTLSTTNQTIFKSLAALASQMFWMWVDMVNCTANYTYPGEIVFDGYIP